MPVHAELGLQDKVYGRFCRSIPYHQKSVSRDTVFHIQNCHHLIVHVLKFSLVDLLRDAEANFFVVTSLLFFDESIQERDGDGFVFSLHNLSGVLLQLDQLLLLFTRDKLAFELVE